MKAAKFIQRRRHNSDVNTMELNVHIIILVFKDLNLLFKVCLMRRCGVHYSSALVRTAFKWSSNLSVYQDHLRTGKHRLLGFHPKFLIQYFWIRAWELAFLTCSQVVLMLLGQGTYLENHHLNALFSTLDIYYNCLASLNKNPHVQTAFQTN